MAAVDLFHLVYRISRKKKHEAPLETIGTVDERLTGLMKLNEHNTVVEVQVLKNRWQWRRKAFGEGEIIMR